MSAEPQRAPPSHKVPQELLWTRKICGGVCRDIAARYPYFVSDWTDAFTGGHFRQSSASICFMYFCCLPPTVVFGTMYQANTEQQIGVLECVLLTALAGMIHAVFAGQPMCIMGMDNVLLRYTTAFYTVCKAWNVDFLPALLWFGLWSGLLLMLFALTDACSLMQYATRYTVDIYSAFVSMWFIIEAVHSILSTFARGRTAGFFTVILAFGTYLLIMLFKHLKDTLYLNKALRHTIADFAVTFAIVIGTGVAHMWKDVDIGWLEVPPKIEPTYIAGDGQRRPWLVNPFGNQGLNATGEKRDFPVWAIFAISVPGLGMALLTFLDQNLVTLQLNRKDHKLKKPVGHHLDMLVVGLEYATCTLLGLPHPGAVTERSNTHLTSLTIYEDLPGGSSMHSWSMRSGGTHKVVSSVIEQRWTAFAVHMLMFLSLFASSILKYVPKAPLFGVFLYMGVTSMEGNQLFDRMSLWLYFTPSTYPPFPYVTWVRTSRMHLFTVIQVLMLAILSGLALVEQTAVAFPFFIVLLIPIRLALANIFTKEELALLDSPDSQVLGEVEPEEDPVVAETAPDYSTFRASAKGGKPQG